MEPEDQIDLFAEAGADGLTQAPEGDKARPLAVRMRPRNLSEVVGQEHILGPGSLLKRLVAQNNFGSLLFYGPPGTGKTSIAEAIARETRSRFVRVNAVMSNMAELRDVLGAARRQRSARTILFIDELHRFNKTQQDLLLPDVEEGAVRLIGATTHNPGFYVNPPLLSRSHLFRLEPLSTEAVAGVLASALGDPVRGLGALGVTSAPGILAELAVFCDGDLRRALNALEVIALGKGAPSQIAREDLEIFARERRIRYDADDEHYDTISAFIKSCRGSDPDAAMYWLAKMLVGGEDPRFVARRLVILASEDVGLADPHALLIAVAAHHAVEFVGLPEAELTLAHATLYIATAPKSNSASIALGEARRVLAEQPVQSVPEHLSDKGGQASKRMAQGKARYAYSHEFQDNVSGQDFLNKPLHLYTPKAVGAESAIGERLARWKGLKASLQSGKGLADRNQPA
jgi:putative ATPase